MDLPDHTNNNPVDLTIGPIVENQILRQREPDAPQITLTPPSSDRLKTLPRKQELKKGKWRRNITSHNLGKITWMEKALIRPIQKEKSQGD
ncbi:hypothetical protein LWI29_015307 [Acer saccharum]|uniref:Uncharacterized protein n=1 Tax=Acer saccharum TaxID=4024 RepID=A0AA39RD37_ACESA|nr:hypothetical protein LWI29_015307 [Acer saccharum]